MSLLKGGYIKKCEAMPKFGLVEIVNRGSCDSCHVSFDLLLNQCYSLPNFFGTKQGTEFNWKDSQEVKLGIKIVRARWEEALLSIASDVY